MSVEPGKPSNDFLAEHPAFTGTPPVTPLVTLPITPAGSAIAPFCPRCGYDMTAMCPSTAASPDALQQTGTCSECGLSFTWQSLFDIKAAILPKFVEHSKGFFATIFAAWRTWLWAIIPEILWRKATLDRPVRINRAFLWMLIIIVGSRLAEVVLVAACSLYDNLATLGLPPSILLLLDSLTYAYKLRYNMRSWYALPPIVAFMLYFSIAAGAMFFLLPFTRAQAKIRCVLVIRVAIYSLAPLAVWNIILLLDMLRAVLDINGVFSGITSSSLPVRITQSVQDFADFFKPYAIHMYLGITLWQFWYWYAAIHRGLRIKRPLVVTLSIVIVAALAAAALTAYGVY